jgi:predicted dehydrogenase
MRTPVSIGVVTAAPEGVALARAFHELAHASVRWICGEAGDLGRADAKKIGANWTSDFDELLADETIDAIALALPPTARRRYTRAALESDRHVLVCGAVAPTVAEAEELLELAAGRHRRLWMHEPALFTPSVQRLRALAMRGGLGELLYLHATKLGSSSEADAGNALWAGCAELLALILDIAADDPIEVTARAESYLRPGTADVAFCDLRFATGITAHLHVSVLDAIEQRRLTAVGSSLTGAIDFLEPRHELTLAAPVDAQVHDSVEAHSVAPGESLRTRAPEADPVLLSCQRFIERVRSTAEPEEHSGAPGLLAQALGIEAIARALSEPEQMQVPRAATPRLQIVVPGA